MSWLVANWGMIATVLWGICETLAIIPAVKSNSVFTLIYNTLKSLKGSPPPQLPG
jgi:hypothetical protein